jgi:integrase
MQPRPKDIARGKIGPYGAATSRTSFQNEETQARPPCGDGPPGSIGFHENLRADPTVAARALEACILTATRTGEILGARWSEIDLGERVWTIPAVRTKAGREHGVPLSSPALKVVETLSKLRTCDFVFPSPRGKRPL